MEPTATPSATPSSDAATSRYVRVRVQAGQRELQLHYNDIGRGTQTIVMLHGSGPGASGWSNFHRNVEALAAAGYRVLLLDLPGWSRSDAVVCDGSRSALNAQALEGLLDALGLERVHLIGNSMGGHAVVYFALEHPQRVGKLVAMGGGTGGASLFAPMPTEGIKLVQAVYRDPSLENVRRLMATFVYDATQIDDAFLRARHENMLARPDHLQNFVESLRLNPRQFDDVGARLATLAVPTLLIWGRDDRFVPLDVGLRMMASLPDAQLHVFGRCGHWAQWEHADRFNRLVIDFLRD